ncbi:MAG: hypothetical protein K0S55_597 [Clostridia bacterium]|nr:hypothetical protein [Clostridia bacterium]
MKFRFSVDDNIWFLKDIANNNYISVFDNEYLGFYKLLHDKYNVKIQLNIFYSTEGFNLSQMPDKYNEEWKANSDWLKLSFHAFAEFPDKPYLNSGREELKRDCQLIHKEIIRFAGADSLDLYTTVHWAVATTEGCLGLKDCGIKGLVGLFDSTGLFYHLSPEVTEYLHKSPYYKDDETGLLFFNNEMVINSVGLKDIQPILNKKIGKEFIEIMIHEQYFYKDYKGYQADFKEKVITAISYLTNNGYKSVFLDEIADNM